jgi:hypothetical protein
MFNFLKKILIFLYIYFIVLSIELITLEKDTLQIDMNIYYYIKITIFIYFAYIIYLFIQLISDYLKKKNNIENENNEDTTYVFIVTSIIIDCILNIIYIIFYKKFIKNHREEYLNNKLFMAYVIPKIVYSLFVTILVMILYIIIILYLIDVFCFGKMLFNSFDYCRGANNRIFIDYDN